MKKLILLLLIVPLSLFSQWSFSEKNDSFDGKYTAGYGIGHNGEFPYEYPRPAPHANAHTPQIRQSMTDKINPNITTGSVDDCSEYISSEFMLIYSTINIK